MCLKQSASRSNSSSSATISGCAVLACEAIYKTCLLKFAREDSLRWINFLSKASKMLRRVTCHRSTAVTLTFIVALISPQTSYTTKEDRPGKNESTKSGERGLRARKIWAKCSTQRWESCGLNFCCTSRSRTTKIVHLICSRRETARGGASCTLTCCLRSSVRTLLIKPWTLTMRKSFETSIRSAIKSYTRIWCIDIAIFFGMVKPRDIT